MHLRVLQIKTALDTPVMVTPPCCGGRTTEFRNQRAEPTVGPLKPKGRKQTYTDKGTRDRNSSDHRT